MKKLMSGLKNLNYKDFLLEHVEKIALGITGCLLVMVLATSQWSRFDKKPEDILQKVRTAESAIQNSTWPEEKRAQFSLRDFAGDAQRVRGPLAVTNLEYSTNMWWPLYRKQELAKETEWLAVLDLRADAGQFALPINTSPPAGEMLAADGEGMEAKSDTETNPFADQFAPVRGATGIAGAAGAGAPGAGAEPGAAYPFGAPPGAAAVAAVDPANLFASEPGMMGEYGGMQSIAREARGERFIAVRGVWPLWQQMEKIQRALNLQTTNDARNFLQLLDFRLERQTAVAGDDPWAGPWDAIDIQRALDVLDEAADYDLDQLDPQIIDPVITMPLPARLVGIWGKYATHPRIEKFTLPPAELEREQKLQDKLIEEYNKYNLEMKKNTIEKKGFSGRSFNVRGLAETMFESEYSNEFDTTMRSAMEQDPTMRMQLPDLKSRLTAVGRLVLFRYMDFDVRPGYAYRYRVKLVLRNPNYQRPIDQVLEQSVAEGTERETPWSNTSNPAVVPDSVNYFLVDIERDPTTESRINSSRPLARMDFFEWDAGVGTMINDVVELKSFGQFISETKKSLRLDVAKPAFKDTEVTFRSDDVLLDTLADIKVDSSLHPDLQLRPALRGKVGIVPEAVIVDESGAIASLDQTTRTSKHNNLQAYVRAERAPWESIKNAEEKPQGEMMGAEGMFEGGAGPYGEMMAAEAGGMAPTTRKKSRRSRKPPAGMFESASP